MDMPKKNYTSHFNGLVISGLLITIKSQKYYHMTAETKNESKQMMHMTEGLKQNTHHMTNQMHKFYILHCIYTSQRRLASLKKIFLQ